MSFTLSCKGKPLKDAQLRAVVEQNVGGNVTTLVSGLPVAAKEGEYEVSWITPGVAPNGQYTVSFYREGERIRADSTPIFTIPFNHEVSSFGTVLIYETNHVD